MAGIGARRFVHAPSDIARRFITLAGTGELEWHVGVTLYRVFLSNIMGPLPAVAVVLLMCMFNPVRLRVARRSGSLIWNAWELSQVNVMFVGIVTIGILGLITSVLFQEIERKAVPWKTE